MIYLIPVLNAIFGWGIIALMFHWLFRPYKKKKFFIIEIQGFIPSNLTQWGEELAEFAERELLNISRMKERLLQGGKMAEIQKMVEAKVDHFLRHKLKEKMPVLSIFITDSLVEKMKEVLMDELQQLIPSTIETLANDMQREFDVKKLLNDKLQQISPRDLEILFYKKSGKAPGLLKMMVALAGFVLGCIEVGLLVLL